MTSSNAAAITVPAVPRIFGAEPAPSPADAIAHLRAKLAFETDASDVWAELEAGAASFVLVDTRSEAAWAQGRASGAVHLPTARIAAEAAALLPAGTNVVVYCWSPGCNGSTRAALALALQGYAVREMIGGFEYWAREGYPVETDAGTAARPVDALVGPVSSGAGGAGIRCDC